MLLCYTLVKQVSVHWIKSLYAVVKAHWLKRSHPVMPHFPDTVLTTIKINELSCTLATNMLGHMTHKLENLVMVIDTTSGINGTDSTSIKKRVGVVTFKN